jgi:hypothetical protein
VIFLEFGAVSYAAGFWNYFNGSSASSNSYSASNVYAPCPYTSQIPNNAPVSYAPAPVYNPAPVYTPPVYQNNPSAVPTNPYSGYSNLIVYCNRGFMPNPSMTACVPVTIPAHAHLSIWGDTYDCDAGYNSLGNTCAPDSYLPAQAGYGQYPY